MSNDIYDTSEIRKSDEEMEMFLRGVGSRENKEFIQRVADRFAELSRDAINRKHWTGSE